jgi:hypothetical protein
MSTGVRGRVVLSPPVTEKIGDRGREIESHQGKRVI